MIRGVILYVGILRNRGFRPRIANTKKWATRRDRAEAALDGPVTDRDARLSREGSEQFGCVPGVRHTCSQPFCCCC